MPREGYRSITVNEEIYKELEEKAEASHRTVPEYIEHLLEIEKQLQKEVPDAR
jgi:predicted CopG family antitoxin